VLAPRRTSPPSADAVQRRERDAGPEKSLSRTVPSNAASLSARFKQSCTGVWSGNDRAAVAAKGRACFSLFTILVGQVGQVGPAQQIPGLLTSSLSPVPWTRRTSVFPTARREDYKLARSDHPTLAHTGARQLHTVTLLPCHREVFAEAASRRCDRLSLLKHF
jgi:hypothetical protein